VKPRAASGAEHHARQSMVTALTGRPATNRRHIWSACCGPGRTSRPSQASAWGIRVVRWRRQFLQLVRGLGVRPAMLVGLGRATPPDFVANAQGPRWLSHGPLDQAGAPFFVSDLCRIGTGHPRLGPLPGHSSPAQGHTHGFVADQPRRQTLGETHLGGQCERPLAGRLAERPWNAGATSARRDAQTQRRSWQLWCVAATIAAGTRRGRAGGSMNGVAHRLIVPRRWRAIMVVGCPRHWPGVAGSGVPSRRTGTGDRSLV